LFVADGGVKVDPDDVAGLRTIVTRLRCQRAVPDAVNLVVLDRFWNLWKQRVQPTLGK